MAVAKGYELVVYRLGGEGEEAQSVLSQRISGSALGWTPSLDRCLERGGRYAWSVRAMGAKEDSEWSQPNLFEVASGPSEVEFEEALQVVRQYLEEEATGSEATSPSSGAQSTGSSPLAPQVSDAPAPLAAVAGDSAVQVNGSPVVTVASLAGALCSTTEVRFLDLGDGTVLDCNTGKIWLKDAGCLGQATYDGVNPTVFDKVADLNNGTDFACADYTAGRYTDWEVPEIEAFCSRDPRSPGLCPIANASDSLVDSSVGQPTVVNASGDGVWMEDDAFVGVQLNSYWSASEVDANDAWLANLTGGIGFLSKATGQFVWPVRGGQ